MLQDANLNAVNGIEKPIPSTSTEAKPVPKSSDSVKPSPNYTDESKKLPPTENESNIVSIGKRRYSIKPTKLRYQRDRTAFFYHILDLYPLPDILAMDRGIVDPERDGDKCLFDWLVAVFDSSKIVSEIYNEMDSATIYRLLEIFKRVNRINEQGEKAKNLQSKETRR